jgi:hypothetical protein
MPRQRGTLLTTRPARRYASRTALIVAALSLAAAGPGAAASASASHRDHTVCSGGIVQPGVYPTLLIVGSCTISESGLIRVLADLTVAPDARLTDPDGQLEVDGNLDVGGAATLTVGSRTLPGGCDPAYSHPCPLRPQNAPHDDAGASFTVHGSMESIDSTNIRVINDSPASENFEVYQNAPDLGGSVKGGQEHHDGGPPGASGGFQSAYVLVGVRIGGTVDVQGQDDAAIDISDDSIGHNLIVSDDEANAGDAPLLAGDHIGNSLDCNHDQPPPTDDSGGIDHARDGAHGECRHL